MYGRWRHLLLVVALMTLTGYEIGGPQPAGVTVVRGPYLQRGAPKRVVIRWRTSGPAETRVWLGTSVGNLVEVYSDPASKTEHEARINRLTPNTEYYYAIGSEIGVLAGDDQEHRFRTSPVAGTTKPTRIWVIGDSGLPGAGARSVRDSYFEYTAGRETDVWIMLGDNAYDVGTDSQYQAGLFEMYPTLLRNTFLWPALGNHDSPNADSPTETGVYFDIFTLPRRGEAGGLASRTEAYYSFDYANIHFICLDSEDTGRSRDGKMMTWLEADLASTSADWIIAYWHHPPHSKGSHDSDNKFDSAGKMLAMRRIALPILEAGGADLVLAGHSHSYERSYLLDGHYGRSNTLTPEMILDSGDGRMLGDGPYVKPGLGGNEGTVYAVVGSSASRGYGPLDHPAMSASFSNLGSLIIDVDGDRLDVRFLTGSGTVKDRFTMLKGVQSSLMQDQPSVSLTTGGRQNLFLDAGPENAGKSYILAGSLGTSPGIDLGRVHVPLNDDHLFRLTTQARSTSGYQNTRGVLDERGRAQAAITVPILDDPTLIGREVYHAFWVFGPSGFVMSSNTVKLTLKN